MTTERGAVPAIVPDPGAWRMTYAEIAAIAQVQRPVPTTWSRRHPDFPRPVAHENGRPLFDGHAVVDWLSATGRGNADPAQLRAELALHTLGAWHACLPGPVLVGALTGLICLRAQIGIVLSEYTWDRLLEDAAYLDGEDTFLAAELRAVPDPGRIGPALAALADQLIEGAYSPSEAFEWVLQARQRLGVHDPEADEPVTAVVQALAALTGVGDLGEGSVVAVPRARSGDLLAALHARAADDADHTYLASDPDPSRARLVRRRMLTRGLYEIQLDVADGDDPAFGTWGAPSLVACVLPYQPAESRDPRAVLERVQDLTDDLGEGATAVVLGPADVLTGALTRHSEADRMRRSFVGSGLLKAAITLPEGVLPHRPGHRTAVWLLARTAPGDGTGVVFLYDYSAQPLTRSILDALADEIALWRTAGWRADGRHEPRHGVVVPVAAIDRPGTAFVPRHLTRERRYTRAAVERPALIADLEQRLTDLQHKARDQRDLRAALPGQVVQRPDAHRVPRTTVKRLLREGRLRRQVGHRIAAEHLSPDGHYPVLTPEEVLGTARVGGRRIDRGVLLTAYEHAQFTEPGDVVITTTPRFGAYVDEEGLSVVAHPARILRVRRDAEVPLRPRVLAALLSAAAADHGRVSGAVRAARSPEDFLIPDLDRDEAERLDAVLAEIESRAALLREQTRLLDDLTRITAAGFVDGTLTIHDRPRGTKAGAP